MRIIQPARKARTKNQDGSKFQSSDSHSESDDFLSSSDLFSGKELQMQGTQRNNKIERTNSKSAQNVDPAKKEFNDLMAKGIRLLAMREHSIKEINDKLSAKALSKGIVQAVLDALIENKYVSDERFSESYVRSRANRGFGPIKIRAELKNKGINNQLIAEYLDMNSAIWLDNARDQYQKKYGDTVVSDYNTWTKRARFMQSRGFTMEHIQVSLPAVELYD